MIETEFGIFYKYFSNRSVICFHVIAAHLSYSLFCFYAEMGLKSVDYKLVYSSSNGNYQGTGSLVPSNDSDEKRETSGHKQVWDSLSFPNYPLEFIIELLDGEVCIRQIRISFEET